MDLVCMVYLLRYDIVHKQFDGTVECKKDGDKEFLVVNGIDICVLHERHPPSIPGAACGANFVCESTGVFTANENAVLHIKVGCTKVLISALPRDALPIMSWADDLSERG